MRGRIDWLAVVIGGVFNWLWGWLWFGPLFGSIFARIVPGADGVGGFNLQSLMGLGLSLVVATGLGFVLARSGVRSLAGAMGTGLLVCVAFNTTVYGGYLVANEKPALQVFIAIYDLVAFVLTAAVIYLIARRNAPRGLV